MDLFLSLELWTFSLGFGFSRDVGAWMGLGGL